MLEMISEAGIGLAVAGGVAALIDGVKYIARKELRKDR